MATIQGSTPAQAQSSNSSANRRTEGNRRLGRGGAPRGRRTEQSTDEQPAPRTQDAAVVTLSGASQGTQAAAQPTKSNVTKLSFAGANVVNIAEQGGQSGQGKVLIFGSGGGPGAVTPASSKSNAAQTTAPADQSANAADTKKTTSAA